VYEFYHCMLHLTNYKLSGEIGKEFVIEEIRAVWLKKERCG